MKLTDRIKEFTQKHTGKIGLAGMAAVFATVVDISESKKIGCYRPEGLMNIMTSYCAYQKGESTVLYPPFIKGMGHGGIWDHGSDGTVEVVGTVGYPRIPPLFIPVERLSEEQREQNQNLYDTIMEEIRKSAE
ncbi:MAG TPA: hypothetical protein VJI98_06330 [Candidatus Nanoarchaeia archaeon]|nr:hypothetical protein [Candidatus Nanoarchaeia archaeon]